jgi:hypothetical protein
MPKRRELPDFWISIDPGDKWVGYASWNPWLAAQQSHSEMWTPQMIGALHHIARRHNIPFEKPQASKLKEVYDNPELRARLYKHIGQCKHGNHAKDAEAHGLRYVVQLELQRAGYA